MKKGGNFTGSIKKWLESSGMAAIVFIGVIGFVLAIVLSVFFHQRSILACKRGRGRHS